MLHVVPMYVPNYLVTVPMTMVDANELQFAMTMVTQLTVFQTQSFLAYELCIYL